MYLLVLYGCGFIATVVVILTAMHKQWNERVVTYALYLMFFWVVMGFALFLWVKHDDNPSKVSCGYSPQLNRDC